MAAFMECCLLILVLDKKSRYFKLLSEFIALIFFVISCGICFMAYLKYMEKFDIVIIFKWQHIVFLIAAINFLVLFVLTSVTCGCTMHLISDANINHDAK